MKPLSKSTSNFRGRYRVNRILYFSFYRIVHICFSDFQLINGLDFKVHACMSTTTTCKGLWTNEPWRDLVRNWDLRIKLCWINHVCTSFNLGKHLRHPPLFFICCWLLVSCQHDVISLGLYKWCLHIALSIYCR